jgi:hypothetical protein
MIDKKKKEIEWWKTHTLTDEEKRKLIQEKLERAQNYLKSLTQREMLIQKYR